MPGASRQSFVKYLTWSVLLLTIGAQPLAESSQHDNSDRLVRWSNLPNPDSSDDFLVNVTVNGIHLDYVPIDTGSTGFLISAKSLGYDDDSELKKCCEPAFEFLSSSRRFYEGYWLPSTVALTSVTDEVFYSYIPVFAVTESGNCSTFKDGHCNKDQRRSMPTGTRYMGVGFGRWSSEQPDATADKNALLNIDFGKDDTLRRGYIVSKDGIVLGVRSNDFTEGWAFTNLTCNNNSHSTNDRTEWNGTPMCVEVAGSECFPGTALFDTGINYSFLGVPTKATQNVNETSGKIVTLKNGTEVTVRVGTMGNFVSNFTFRVADSSAEPHVAPNRVRVVREHVDGAYINTGRSFYNGFSLLYDEENGVVGLKRKMLDEVDNQKLWNQEL